MLIVIIVTVMSIVYPAYLRVSSIEVVDLEQRSYGRRYPGLGHVRAGEQHHLVLDDEVDEGSEEEERQEAAQQQQQPRHQAPDRHQQAAVRGPHPQEHRRLSTRCNHPSAKHITLWSVVISD